MALSAADRAQKAVDKVQGKIDAIEGRKAAAVEKVSARYADELSALEAERAFLLQHPALAGVPEDASELDVEGESVDA